MSVADDIKIPAELSSLDTKFEDDALAAIDFFMPKVRQQVDDEKFKTLVNFVKMLISTSKVSYRFGVSVRQLIETYKESPSPDEAYKKLSMIQAGSKNVRN